MYSSNDTAYSGFDYKDKILKKTLSKVLFRDPVKSNILSYFEKGFFALVETTKQIKNYFSALERSRLNFILIYPNNDPGSYKILNKILKYKNNKKFKIIKSMRFEYFLRILKNSKAIITPNNYHNKKGKFSNK
jgi:UDP-N-acetylglucosamine 2-epimerase